jgi:carbonic anhydrase
MMMKSIVLALALLTSAVSGNEDADWSWEGETGPEHWEHLGYHDCGGKEQSPIEISAKAAGHPGMESKLHPLEKYVNSVSANYAVSPAHGGPKFSCRVENTCGDITWKGVTYYLNQVHLHSKFFHLMILLSLFIIPHTPQ